MTLQDGWPPFYGERASSAVVDVNQLYLAYVIGALIFAIFLILPGVRGVERLYFLLRWIMSLVIGAVIIACGQGLAWQVATSDADFRYRVNDENLTQFNLALRIGLTQFNVTLSGGNSQDGQQLDLNEKYHFVGLDKLLERSLVRGVPFPILMVAEHFSSNRFHSLWPWGRRYWLAGHYASYLLWTSFACWILSNVLFNMVLRHGSLFLILTGAFLLSADISFATVNVGGKLTIPVGYYDPREMLELSYGWCFWVSLFTGVLCIVLGAIAILLDVNRKKYLEKFFMFEKEEERSFSESTPVGTSQPSKGILKKSSSAGQVNRSFVVEVGEDSVHSDHNGNASIDKSPHPAVYETGQRETEVRVEMETEKAENAPVDEEENDAKNTDGHYGDSEL